MIIPDFRHQMCLSGLVSLSAENYNDFELYGLVDASSKLSRF